MNVLTIEQHPEKYARYAVDMREIIEKDPKNIIAYIKSVENFFGRKYFSSRESWSHTVYPVLKISSRTRENITGTVDGSILKGLIDSGEIIRIDYNRMMEIVHGGLKVDEFIEEPQDFNADMI